MKTEKQIKSWLKIKLDNLLYVMDKKSSFQLQERIDDIQKQLQLYRKEP